MGPDGIVTSASPQENALDKAILGRMDIRTIRDAKISQAHEYFSLYQSTAADETGGFLKVTRGESLLHPHDQATSGCENASARDTMWNTDPEFPSSMIQMGFLSQLAQLCLRSGIKSCQYEACRAKFENMKLNAPKCEWESFRTWALTTMSCQAVMRNDTEGLLARTVPHTHIARAVAGCCMILRTCCQPGMDALRPFLDGEEGEPEQSDIPINQVVNVVYWMAKIQEDITIGPAGFGRWGSELLPDQVYRPSLADSMRLIGEWKSSKGIDICRSRLWNLVEVSERKEADLPEILEGLSGLVDDTPGSLKTFWQNEVQPVHTTCVSGYCVRSSINSTKTEQAHKCSDEGTCQLLTLDATLLDKAEYEYGATAWGFQESENGRVTFEPTGKLRQGEKYMAVSHVWSDGTGKGQHRYGVVNECLFDYWAKQARALGCDAIWWDAISMPQQELPRKWAMRNMHENYKKAHATVVHDNGLRRISSDSNATACVATVMSDWFTRGWTALELAKSEDIYVLLQGPDGADVLKNLNELLAEDPTDVTRVHWLASEWIRRLREPIDDVGDLIAILNSRITSWQTDRPIIAAHLADVRGFDPYATLPQINQEILKTLGKIPQTSLLHGKPTMKETGGFSWCTVNLEDMCVAAPADMESAQVSDLVSMLRIDLEGAVTGEWWCRDLKPEDVGDQDPILPYGTDLSTIVRIENALASPELCLLLRPAASSNEDPALLVQPLCLGEDVLDCQYIGAVFEQRKEKEPIDDVHSGWHCFDVRLGHEAPEILSRPAENAQQIMRDLHEKDADKSRSCGEIHDHGFSNLDGPGRYHRDELRLSLEALWYPMKYAVESFWHSIESWNPRLKIESPNGDQLVAAVQGGKAKAIQYLVAEKHRFGAPKVEELVEMVMRDRDTDLSTVYGLCFLGQSYAEQEDLAGAEEAFSVALKTYHEMPDKSEVSHLHSLIHSNLGHIVSFDSGRGKDAAERLEEALRQCQNHRSALPAKSKVKMVRKSRISGIPARYRQNKHRNGISTELLSNSLHVLQKHANHTNSFQSKDQPSTTPADWENDLGKWDEIEWATLAWKIIHQIAFFKYEGAARTYWQALAKLFSIPGSWQEKMYSEAFCPLSQLPGDEAGLRKRGSHYTTAQKRFDLIFRGGHNLCYVTFLHIGATHFHLGEFHKARPPLELALKGFKKSLGLWRRMHGDDHNIVALTQYYLCRVHTGIGKTLLGKSRISEAYEHFKISAQHLEEGKNNFAMNNALWVKGAFADAQMQLDGPKQVVDEEIKRAGLGREVEEKEKARLEEEQEEKKKDIMEREEEEKDKARLEQQAASEAQSQTAPSITQTDEGHVSESPPGEASSFSANSKRFLRGAAKSMIGGRMPSKPSIKDLSSLGQDGSKIWKSFRRGASHSTTSVDPASTPDEPTQH